MLVENRPGADGNLAAEAVARSSPDAYTALVTGFEATNVNYKASPQAMTDLLGGQVDFYIGDIATALVQVRAGKVTPLGVTLGRRLPAAPDIPTIAEQGFPDFEFFSWLAVWVPAGAPPEDVRRPSELINQAMDADAGRENLHSRGLLPYPGSPQMLQELQTRETERWGRAIRAAGMQPQ